MSACWVKRCIWVMSSRIVVHSTKFLVISRQCNVRVNRRRGKHDWIGERTSVTSTDFTIKQIEGKWSQLLLTMPRQRQFPDEVINFVRELRPFLQWFVLRVVRDRCSFRFVCDHTYLDREHTLLALPAGSPKRRCAQKDVAELTKSRRKRFIVLPSNWHPESDSNPQLFLSPALNTVLDTALWSQPQTSRSRNRSATTSQSQTPNSSTRRTLPNMANNTDPPSVTSRIEEDGFV